MKLIRGLHNLPSALPSTVVTIGNFDGLHLGHQHLLSRLKSIAKSSQRKTAVILFEPQPQEFFQFNNWLGRIHNFREKINFLKTQKIDYAIFLRFDEKLKDRSAENFVRTILIEKCQCQHLVIGDDFRFGYQREGDFAFLKKISAQLNFTVESSKSIEIHGTRISSSAIRKALSQGDFETAEQLLGYPYHFTGRVCHGDKRGRQIGFPTANLAIKRKKWPLSGVFAITAQTPGGLTHKGVANIGKRPTFSGQKILLEVHLFDFNDDLYGKKLIVTFKAKIRDEKKFHSLESLVKQITEDAETARQYHQSAP